MHHQHGLTPRLKPLSARRSTTLSVLDIGTSKIVCLIAELQPAEALSTLRGRTHFARIIGIGHQRSQGLKGGAIVDLEAAEGAIRQAVHAAERMAKVEVQSVIVNMSGGRIGSQHFEARVNTRTGTVTGTDVERVLETASAHGVSPGRAVLHALPTGYAIDGQGAVIDPSGMMGDALGVDLHVATGEAAAARNLMLAVEHCHLGVEAVIATPYAAGLSALVDDEAEMGVCVVDMGGGTTSVGVFSGGHLVHVDAIAVGGHHVAMDIARGLSTRVAAAERLKTLYGSALPTASDDRDMIAVHGVGEDEGDAPIRTDAAVAHDLETPLPGGAAAEPVGDVGQTILVQGPGDQDTRGHRQGRGEERPEAEPPGRQQHETTGQGQDETGQGQHPGHAGEIRSGMRVALAGQGRHRQAGVEAQARSPVVGEEGPREGRLVPRILAHRHVVPPSPPPAPPL